MNEREREKKREIEREREKERNRESDRRESISVTLHTGAAMLCRRPFH